MSVDSEYLEHWYTIINPLEELLGMKCIAFDPGILLLEPGTIDCNSTMVCQEITLSWWNGRHVRLKI